MNDTVFALVDCNNFYASCEKLFRPDLREKPVVVLSNNDGCIVARSAEAKALGIKMGTPYYQVQAQLKRQGVVVFSSNYALYGDMSQRVMNTLESLVPDVEVYSIDEAFLNLTGLQASMSLETFGQQVRRRVYQWTGITTCVGIAPTKTLAKLANHAAKAYPATGGVVDLTSLTRQRKLMGLVPVGEVWGIGRQLSAQLESFGVMTALQLADTNPDWIGKRFSVVVKRTVLELNGHACLALEEEPPARQQVLCSRSFADAVTRISDMHELMARFVERAAAKLRQENQQAKVLSVFIRTSAHHAGNCFYSRRATVELLEYTSDTRRLTQAAQDALKTIWQDGFQYKKGGVLLNDLKRNTGEQLSLFEPSVETPKSEALMRTLDEIHRKGLGQVFLAARGTRRGSEMKQARLSPAYTTRWRDLPRV